MNVMISSIWQGQVDLQRISSKGNRSNTGNIQITFLSFNNYPWFPDYTSPFYYCWSSWICNKYVNTIQSNLYKEKVALLSSIWQGQVDLQRISSKGNRSNTGNIQITVKPVHVVTSIKQSLVLKGHLFLSCHKQFDMNWTPFKRLPVL
jgi:hypothetical protein